MRDDPRTDATFNGTIPEMYDRYLGPLLFEAFAIDLARRIGTLKPQNVLEVAAGTGIVTRQMLKTLPRNSRLSVTDLNDPMIDHARRLVGEDSRVSWRQADAMALPFDDGEFDAAVCQFGIMFYPDKPRGMREFQPPSLSVGFRGRAGRSNRIQRALKSWSAHLASYRLSAIQRKERADEARRSPSSSRTPV